MNEEYQKKLAEAQALREAELKRRAFLKRVLEPGAFERIMRIRMSSPELYSKLFQLLYYLYQSNQLSGKVGEEKLKAMAAKLVEKKREPVIKRLAK